MELSDWSKVWSYKGCPQQNKALYENFQYNSWFHTQNLQGNDCHGWGSGFAPTLMSIHSYIRPSIHPSVCHKSKPQNSIKSIIPHNHNLHHHTKHHTQQHHMISHTVSHTASHKASHTVSHTTSHTHQHPHNHALEWLLRYCQALFREVDIIFQITHPPPTQTLNFLENAF